MLVARLNGVESVREFLSGAAVTVALDVPFALVFVVLMAFYSVPLTLVTPRGRRWRSVLSLAVAPPLQRGLNDQFLAGARPRRARPRRSGASRR